MTELGGGTPRVDDLEVGLWIALTGAQKGWGVGSRRYSDMARRTGVFESTVTQARQFCLDKHLTRPDWSTFIDVPTTDGEAFLLQDPPELFARALGELGIDGGPDGFTE